MNGNRERGGKRGDETRQASTSASCYSSEVVGEREFVAARRGCVHKGGWRIGSEIEKARGLVVSRQEENTTRTIGLPKDALPLSLARYTKRPTVKCACCKTCVQPVSQRGDKVTHWQVGRDYRAHFSWCESPRHSFHSPYLARAVESDVVGVLRCAVLQERPRSIDGPDKKTQSQQQQTRARRANQCFEGRSSRRPAK